MNRWSPGISKCGKRFGGTTGATRARGARRSISSPDQLVQAMFAVSRAKTDEGPVQIYLVTSELSACELPNIVWLLRLCASWRANSTTLVINTIFSEFQELNDASIVLFMDTAEALTNLPNPLRGNTLGMFQANIGLWQILARQGQYILSLRLNDSWQQVIKPFSGIRSAAQLYDAGLSSLE